MGNLFGLVKIFLKGKSCGAGLPITLTNTQAGKTRLGLRKLLWVGCTRQKLLEKKLGPLRKANYP